jgi:predicted small metal-binding protein
MLKRMSVVLLAVILALFVVLPAAAKDMPKKEKKMTEMKQAGSVKQIACDDACGFVVRSRNEKELVAIAKHHVKTYHKMDVTDGQLKAKITEVPKM